MSFIVVIVLEYWAIQEFLVMLFWKSLQYTICLGSGSVRNHFPHNTLATRRSPSEAIVNHVGADCY